MIQPMNPGTGTGTLYAGGVFNLKSGDYITLHASHDINLFMWTAHSYFGAFLVWASNRSMTSNRRRQQQLHYNL